MITFFSSVTLCFCGSVWTFGHKPYEELFMDFKPLNLKPILFFSKRREPFTHRRRITSQQNRIFGYTS